MNPIHCCILLLLSRVRSQEVSTPSSLLSPRNFNHHPYNALEIIDRLNKVKPTENGPVLFPNDAPPPPRPPLIVTARPLTESIARSELGDNSTLSNTITSQSQINGVSLGPFLRDKGYRPYLPNPRFDYTIVPTRVPFPSVAPQIQNNLNYIEDTYDTSEEPAPVHPIYKAIADHAAQQLVKSNKQNQIHYSSPPKRTTPYQRNEHIDTSSESDNQDYAFSYQVKDKITGDDFSHSQKSTGSATNGEYRVLLPDGRKQIVTYTADERGYKAEVRYDEKHDDYQPNSFKDNENYQPKYSFKDSHISPTESYLNHNHIPEVKIHDYNLKNQKSYIDYYDTKPIEKNDYDSQEYDYSTEYNYENKPHVSKFSQFTPTVIPSYKELEPLFINKNDYSPHLAINRKPSNLYTNIKDNLQNYLSENDIHPKIIQVTTPSSYLQSTINSIKNKVHIAKPHILTADYIARIKKYLKF